MQDNPGAPEGGSLTYLDFEVDIGFGSGREYPVAVIRSPAGEARETMRLPFDKPTLENYLSTLQIALLRSGGAYRRALSPEEQSVQNFGRELFEALLAGEIRSRYDVSLREARQQSRGLRLKLRIHPPELATLPWEFMYDQRQAEYVSLSRDHPIVRYLELPQSVQPLPVTPPLNILGLIASPCGLTSLDIEHEKQRMEIALKDLRAAGLVNLTWLDGSTWRDLHRAMRGGPWHIFHFVGHGSFDPNSDEGLIALTDATGAPHFLRATELGRLLADHSSLRLVLLNSCEGAKGSAQDVFSSTAAILVRRGIPAVVAMQYAITDQAAMEFARAFYEALADGLSVDAAVTEARKAVSLAVANTVEWGTPLLYMRAPEGIIFQLPAVRRSVPRSAPPHDREAALRWETLYTDGLSAFWAEEWDRAIRNFQAILDERPDYPNVAAKLEDARRQQKLSALYDQAVAAQETGDWASAESALEILAAEAADYKDVSARLISTRKQRQLADLHDQAHKLYAAEQWPAVVKVFGQIAVLDPDSKDPEGLLSTAQERVAEQNRRAELDRLYGRAVAELDAGRWVEARQLLRQVQDQSPGLRDTERLLSRAEAELARQAAEQRRQAQIAALYDQAQGLARDRKWQQALAKTDEIRRLDANFADPQGIGERAQREVTAEQAEAQRQSELAALYSEAVQLLQTQQYQAALEKWSQVQASDPRFQDRQKVQATALKKLNELAKASAPRPPVSGRGDATQSRGAIEAAPASRGRIALSRRTILIATGAIALVVAAALGMIQLTGGGKSGPPPPGTTTAGAPTAISSAVAIAPSAATSTAESVVTPAQSTVAAISVPVGQPAEATATTDPFLFDSFDDPVYDGRIDETRWIVGDGCQSFAQGSVQRNGVLELKNASVSQGVDCGLWAEQGTRVPGGALGAIEARMWFAADPNGERIQDRLAVVSELGNQRSVNMECGLEAEGDGPARLAFSVFSNTETGPQLNNERYLEAALDRWYTIRLKLDPETMAVTCLVDGEEFGVYTPANADELRAAEFARAIYLRRAQGATVTSFIDDVRLLPPETPKPKAVGMSPPLVGCVPPPPGMVAWWPGDGSTVDLLGGPTGVPNSAVSWAPGWVGQAFQFDSQGHVVNKGGVVIIPTATEIIGLQMLTIEAWVRLDPDPSAAGQIERFVTVSPEKAVLRKESDGLLHFYMNIDGELRHIWSQIVPRERFIHIVGSYDGRVMRLYLDGQQVGETEISGRVVEADNNTYLGAAPPMHGLLDEVSVYNRALSADEIRAIYQAGQAGKCKP